MYTVDTPATIPWSPESEIDWKAVAQMRTAASKRLSARLGSEDADHQQALGRVIIADLLDEHTSEAITHGTTPWASQYQARIGQAVFDSLFRLGRLQGLVDDDSIENVIICGADNVWIESSDGRLTRGTPVADSDAELIDFLSFIASRSEANERSFSPAEPRLHMRLDSGARLAAAAWVTPRPSVVIRRHRAQGVTLDDLVTCGTLAYPAAKFLAEAVRRRASIVVSGAQGAGKTTLMRALCAEIPPTEVIGTFETEYELHLHLMPDRHNIVYAWEARPGSGEMDAMGRRAGEFLLDDALYDSFRFNLSRQIVGEVRGKEILAMLKAMQSGSGSLSTTHGHSAEAAIRKLITCAMEAGPHVTSEYATRAVAEDIDFVVHMEVSTEKTAQGFKRHRWVKEIIAVEASDSARGYATTRLFSTLPGQRVAGMETVPDGYLQAFDPMEELRNLACP
jgi:Flp pilus assembly CpaF family ATPase